jgi:hypothetical protein
MFFHLTLKLRFLESYFSPNLNVENLSSIEASGTTATAAIRPAMGSVALKL